MISTRRPGRTRSARTHRSSPLCVEPDLRPELRGGARCWIPFSPDKYHVGKVSNNHYECGERRHSKYACANPENRGATSDANPFGPETSPAGRGKSPRPGD